MTFPSFLLSEGYAAIFLAGLIVGFLADIVRIELTFRFRKWKDRRRERKQWEHAQDGWTEAPEKWLAAFNEASAAKQRIDAALRNKSGLKAEFHRPGAREIN